MVVALRKESVDRNGMEINGVSYDVWSLSARRAWIEIIDYIIDYATDAVALRKESVDRNINTLESYNIVIVALRKESVDRNVSLCCLIIKIRVVALRKESVDRNRVAKYRQILLRQSLSARRAWIEIAKSTPEEAKR